MTGASRARWRARFLLVAFGTREQKFCSASQDAPSDE